MTDLPPTVPRYAVVSTVLNEAAYIGQTAEALLAQTVRPELWVVVDDGSTDETTEVVSGYASQHAWIRLLTAASSAGTNRCSRIMSAFLTGYFELDGDYDFVIKMDGDVTFETDHVERLLGYFAENPRLGIASGTYTEPAGQGWRTHELPEGYAVGAMRAYRVACLRDVVESARPLLTEAGVIGQRKSGRAELVMSWDSIDHLYAEQSGWETHCFHDLVIVHHRTEGARSHLLRGQYEQGVVSYAMGYHPLFAFARGVFKMKDYPYVVGGAALAAGYVAAALRPDVIRADAETRKMVRSRQMRRVREALGMRKTAGQGGA